MHSTGNGYRHICPSSFLPVLLKWSSLYGLMMQLHALALADGLHLRDQGQKRNARDRNLRFSTDLPRLTLGAVVDHVFQIEVRAGLTTWAAMAYIIALNANLLSQTGGPCVCTQSDLCVSDPVYNLCVSHVRNDLIVSTAIISSISSLLMGFLVNLPVGLAPGLGVNAYFAFSVVGYHGSGIITYGEALAAVFMEGWIFLILSILGLRQWLVRFLPQSLVLAIGVGIGIFIAFIGLGHNGLGVVGGNTTNFVGLGGCLPENYVSVNLPNYCAHGILRSPTMWLGIFTGGIFTLVLMMYRVRGAILMGILLTSILSWPRSTLVTYFPHTATGDAMYNYFKQVLALHRLEKVGNAIEYNYRNPKVWYALITFLYVDILDNTGALSTMAKVAGLHNPVTFDFEGSSAAYCVLAFCISLGALLGTSPVTVCIESATGISEGGKTGLTAITTGVMFFISIFFAPIFSSFPPWATGGALTIVGSLMIRNVLEINWNYIGDAVPAFITLLMIPLTFNMAYGVIAGVLCYLLLNGIPFILRKISRGRLLPTDYEVKEEWAIEMGDMTPIWVQKVIKFKNRRHDAEEHEMVVDVAGNAEDNKSVCKASDGQSMA